MLRKKELKILLPESHIPYGINDVHSLSLAKDNGLAVVSANVYNREESTNGVYLYKRILDDWENVFTLISKNEDQHGEFISVISGDGKTVAVSSKKFKLEEYLLRVYSISNTDSIYDTPKVKEIELALPVGSLLNDPSYRFGVDLNINHNGDTIIATVYTIEDNTVSNIGVYYTYVKMGQSWLPDPSLALNFITDSIPSNEFGTSTVLNKTGDILLVSFPTVTDTSGEVYGIVNVYSREDDGTTRKWSPINRFRKRVFGKISGFGERVAISSDEEYVAIKDKTCIHVYRKILDEYVIVKDIPAKETCTYMDISEGVLTFSEVKEDATTIMKYFLNGNSEKAEVYAIIEVDSMISSNDVVTMVISKMKDTGKFEYMYI